MISLYVHSYIIMSYVMLDMYILVYTHAGVHLGGGGGHKGAFTPPCYDSRPPWKTRPLRRFYIQLGFPPLFLETLILPPPPLEEISKYSTAHVIRTSHTCLCMYVCVLHQFTHMHAHTHTHTHTHTNTHTHTHTCAHLHTYVNIHTCAYTLRYIE